MNPFLRLNENCSILQLVCTLHTLALNRPPELETSWMDVYKFLKSTCARTRWAQSEPPKNRENGGNSI